MRYFGGLSIEETAEALGVSIITVNRDWRLARTWLMREMKASRNDLEGGVGEIERLFHEAVDLPVKERQALLASVRAPVRAEVESLLETEDEAVFVARPDRLAADLLEQPRALSARERIGDYQIESLITVGGMGEVYLARNRAGFPVALKILRRHLVAFRRRPTVSKQRCAQSRRWMTQISSRFTNPATPPQACFSPWNGLRDQHSGS